MLRKVSAKTSWVRITNISEKTFFYSHLNTLFSAVYQHSSYCLNTWLPLEIRYNYSQLRNVCTQIPTECISIWCVFWYWSLNTFMVLRHSTSFIIFPLFHICVWTLYLWMWIHNSASIRNNSHKKGCHIFVETPDLKKTEWPRTCSVIWMISLVTRKPEFPVASL